MEAKKNPLVRVADYLSGKFPDDPEAKAMAENAIRALAEGDKNK